MTSIFRRLRRDEGGVSALEFSILGPVMLSFMLGSIDMGRMFYVRQGLEYATEEAARYYRLNPTSAESTVTTYLQSKMVGGLGSGVTVAYADTANCNANAAVTCTMVTASYSFTFIASYLGLGTKTLQAKAQAVRY